MKTLSFTVEVKRSRRRAIELYHADSPFRGRSEKSKKIYQRRQKHQHREKFE